MTGRGNEAMQTSRLLSHYDGSRRNNFTAIRFMLAWMVIFAHSFVLQPVPGIGNPLDFLLRASTTTGQMAVDGFFAISGFLVAGSLVNRGLIDYGISRALRVLPGLAVCVVFTILLLGPLVSTLSVTEYFLNPATLQYLKNAFAFPSTVFDLPGVFEGNQLRAVNGSLWSIPYEVGCYSALGLAGLLGLHARKKVANVLLAVLAAGFLWGYNDPELFHTLPHIASALLCFVIGVLFFFNRDKLVLDARLAMVALAALYFSFGEVWFRCIYPLTWTYFLFFLAYRTPFLNLDQRVGDCSYGIYIYAFPVQQLTAHLMPAGTPYTNLMISTAAVIPIAALSWLYIEKPALGLKTRYLTHH